MPISAPKALALRCAMTAVVLLFAAWHISCAQDQGGGLELHAKSNITASDLGLPEYPRSSLYKAPDNDAAVDLGFTIGDVHFRLVAANYLTSGSPAQVLDFYRKPLARYGEVLECDHGVPVGTLKATRSGLTCTTEQIDSMHVNKGEDSSRGRELRAGTPHQFRIVGIDDPVNGTTRFGLVLVELPKDKDKGKD